MAQTAKPSLLIIGGGFAGVTLAVNASSFMDVTLVDRKDFFEINWANPRAIMDPVTAKLIYIPYSNVKKLGKFVQGTVSSLSTTSATLEDGQVIRFDYAAICTGSAYGSNIGRSTVPTIADRMKELESLRAQITSAKDILIVGGGPSGVEMAGEILDFHAGKNITVVHSSNTLLFKDADSTQQKVIKNVDTFFKEHKVTVVTGSRVEKSESAGRQDYVTSKGVTITADVMLWTIAGRPNTAFMANEFGEALESSGMVKVNPSFQVMKGEKALDNIFALGDCNNLKETKLGYLATQHGARLAENLKAKIQSKAGKPWELFGGNKAMFITMGRSGGTGHLGGCILPSCCVGMMKSKGLFISKYYSDLGVPMPSN